MRISLYELFDLCDLDDTDICDDVYDWAVNFSCIVNKSDCLDYYDKLMRLFATKIECNKYRPNGYTNCFVSQFIKDNMFVFTSFLNEENREYCRPKDYDDIDDDVFYDIYMQSIEQLITGGYSDRQYEVLYKMLGGK